MESEEEESRVCCCVGGGQVTICVRWWLFRRPECGVPPAHEMPPTPRPGLELHHHPPHYSWPHWQEEVPTLSYRGLLMSLTGSLVIFKAAWHCLNHPKPSFPALPHTPTYSASPALATLMILLLPTVYPVPSHLTPCCYQVLKVRCGC